MNVVCGGGGGKSVKAWNVSLYDIYIISAAFANKRVVRFGHDARWWRGQVHQMTVVRCWCGMFFVSIEG